MIDMNEFNETFDHLATEAKTDMVGRRVKFRDPQMPRDGLIARDGVFEVVGLQKIHTGDEAYRVRCVEYPEGTPFNDKFGRPMRFEEAEWLDSIIFCEECDRYDAECICPCVNCGVQCSRHDDALPLQPGTSCPMDPAAIRALTKEEFAEVLKEAKGE